MKKYVLFLLILLGCEGNKVFVKKIAVSDFKIGNDNKAKLAQIDSVIVDSGFILEDELYTYQDNGTLTTILVDYDVYKNTITVKITDWRTSFRTNASEKIERKINLILKD